MAVIQISRIQVRRGLHDNLPQLASAEIGWSIDKRKLFIGNGNTTEGAPVTGRTEILTEHSDILQLINVYSFKGESSGSIASTGPNNTQYTRRLQEKLDDVVNVRDFGAKGDGQTDDTLAIRRAFNNTYSYSTTISGVTTRRTIYFPAGRYLLSDIIAIPPFIKLVGDGALSTQFYSNQGDALTHLFTLSDNNGNIGASFGATVGLVGTYGVDYVIEDMGFHNGAIVANPCIKIAGGNRVTFNRVQFEGPAASVVDPGTGHAAVYIENNTLSPAHLAKSITFDNCVFTNHGYGIETANAVTGLIINNCTFKNLYKSRVLSSETTGVTVTSSNTANVSNEVDRNYVNSYDSANVSNSRTVTLSQGSTGTLGIATDVLTNFDNVEIDYTMTVGVSKRRGRLVGVGTAGSYFWDNDYIEAGTINVDLEADGSTGSLTWDTTNASSEVILTYCVKYHN
jgi:hypothetical protein